MQGEQQPLTNIWKGENYWQLQHQLNMGYLCVTGCLGGVIFALFLVMGVLMVLMGSVSILLPRLDDPTDCTEPIPGYTVSIDDINDSNTYASLFLGRTRYFGNNTFFNQTFEFSDRPSLDLFRYEGSFYLKYRFSKDHISVQGYQNVSDHFVDKTCNCTGTYLFYNDFISQIFIYNKCEFEMKGDVLVPLKCTEGTSNIQNIRERGQEIIDTLRESMLHTTFQYVICELRGAPFYSTLVVILLAISMIALLLTCISVIWGKFTFDKHKARYQI